MPMNGQNDGKKVGIGAPLFGLTERLSEGKPTNRSAHGPGISDGKRARFTRKSALLLSTVQCRA